MDFNKDFQSFRYRNCILLSQKHGGGDKMYGKGRKVWRESDK